MKHWKEIAAYVLLAIFLGACAHCAAHDDLTSKLIIAGVFVALLPGAMRYLNSDNQ